MYIQVSKEYLPWTLQPTNVIYIGLFGSVGIGAGRLWLQDTVNEGFRFEGFGLGFGYRDNLFRLVKLKKQQDVQRCKASYTALHLPWVMNSPKPGGMILNNR